jgi:hypothetical protein
MACLVGLACGGCQSSGAGSADAGDAGVEVDASMGDDVDAAPSSTWDGALATGIFVLPAADAGCGADAGTTVDPALLPGAVPPCASGYAHPSVCCRSGPLGNTSCAESQTAPFAPCACEALSFPDPRTCCSLTDAGDCAPPAEAGTDVDAAACSFPCGVGGFLPSLLGPSPPSCTDVPSAVIDGVLVPAPIAGQPACEFCCVGDRGGCSTSSPGTPTSAGCGSCPSGWARVQGVPDLCCQGSGDGAECFSQATGIGAIGSL